MSKVSNRNKMSTSSTESTDNSIAQHVAEYQESVDNLTNSTMEARNGLAVEIDRVNAEMEALEKRRRDMRIEVERVEAAHRVEMATRVERLSAILLRSLAEQSERVRQRIREYANGHALALRRQAIFAAEPNLAKKYGRYQKMAETLPQKLAEFEELDEYAKALLDTHKALQEDVQEILEIDEAIRAIQPPTSELRVDLLYSAEREDVRLIAPAYQVDTTQEAVDLDVGALWLEAIFYAFMAVEVPISEFVAERVGPFAAARVRVPAGWDSPDGLHLLAEQVHLMLNAHIKSDMRIYVTFVQVPEWIASSITGASVQNLPESGELEERDTVSQPTEASAPEVVALEGIEEESEDVDGLGEGWVNTWIRRSDLREWRRKAPDSSGSKWTPHARRVRTVLIRMVGRGAIGSNAMTSISALYDGLPESARADLHSGIEQLLAYRVLASEMSGDAQMLTIASDRLEMVGDLINRDVTPEWEEVLRGEVNKAA